MLWHTGSITGERRSRYGERGAGVRLQWFGFRRADTTYYTLFRRSGGLVVAAADALHELFGGTIDEDTFTLLDDVEHRADSNTHDLLSRMERGHRPPWPASVTRRLAQEIDEIVDRFMEALNIHPRNPAMLLKNLSGGNQQKVLLARWLATSPKVLVLDEPTRGIDVGAKAEVQRLVIELADRGMSVLFISSEFEEVLRVSERVRIVRDRVVADELVNGPELTSQVLVERIAQTPEKGAVA